MNKNNNSITYGNTSNEDIDIVNIKSIKYQ